MAIQDGRLRIYAGNGQPVYDSQGSVQERTVDRIKTEYNSGVAFYYDPIEGIVRGQVKLQRHGPEQFIAAYTAAADRSADLIEAFTGGVKRAADEEGWTIRRTAGGNQAVFDALDSGTAFDPDQLNRFGTALREAGISIDRLRTEFADRTPVTLLVPDYETAAVGLGFFRRTFGDDRRIAITESADAPTVQASDVLFRPTNQVESVAPGSDLKTELRKAEAKAAIEAFETAIDKLAEGVSEDGVSTDADGALGAGRMIQALRARDLYSTVGTRLEATTTAPIWRRSARAWAIRAAPTTLLVAVMLSAVGTPGQPMWILAGTAGVILAMTVVAFGLRHSSPEWLIPGPMAVRPRHDNRDSIPPGADHAAGDAVEALARLRAVLDHPEFDRRVGEVLDSYHITVADPTESEWAQRGGIIAGTAAGFVVGALLFLAVVVIGSLLT